MEGPLAPLKIIVPIIKNVEFWTRTTKFQFIYSLLGLVFGLAFVSGGIMLCLRGITGTVSWITSFLNLKSEISDAAPGVILFLVGLFTIWITRFSVKSRNS